MLLFLILIGDCVLLYSWSFWVAGKHKKFCNSISVGAFLDEGDDISLEEMKNRQNAALTSITSSAASKDGLKGAVGGREFHILPMARHHRGADLIETAAEQDLLCCCSDSLLSPGDACKNCTTSSRDRTHNGDKMAPRTPPSSSSTMLSPVSNLLEVFERMSLEETQDSSSSCRERKSSGGSRHRESWDSYCSSLAPPEGQAAAAAAADGMEERSSSDSSEYFEAEANIEGFGRTRGAVSSVRNICARSKSWDHGGRDLSSSGSSGTSYKSLDHSNELFCRTPPHVRRGLFILGLVFDISSKVLSFKRKPCDSNVCTCRNSPTKLDQEVLLAIEGVELDPQMYPSIQKWKSTMKTYSSSDMQR